jgi:hypothetical protein
MWPAKSKVIRGGLPKPIRAHTPCTLIPEHRTKEFSVYSVGFRSCFGSILPCYFPLPAFCNGHVHSVSWNYITFFLILQRLTVKKLPRVSILWT